MNFQCIDYDFVNGIERDNPENHKDGGFEYVGYRRKLFVVVALCNIEIHCQSDVRAQMNAANSEELDYESVGRAPGERLNEHSYDMSMVMGGGVSFDVQALGKDVYVAVVVPLPPACDDNFLKVRDHSDKNPSNTSLYKHIGN